MESLTDRCDYRNCGGQESCRKAAEWEQLLLDHYDRPRSTYPCMWKELG